MLVLTRRCEESIILAGSIEVKVLGVRGDQVSLGFSAPSDISIYRKEVYDAIERENRNAAQLGPQGQDDLPDLLKKRLGPSAEQEGEFTPPASA